MNKQDNEAFNRHRIASQREERRKKRCELHIGLPWPIRIDLQADPIFVKLTSIFLRKIGQLATALYRWFTTH